MMRFLEDARERQVLRTADSVYQFRHARLQDVLAESAAAEAPSGPIRTALISRLKNRGGVG